MPTKSETARKQVNFRLQPETISKLDSLAEALSAGGARVTKTDALETAVHQLWEKILKKSEKKS